MLRVVSEPLQKDEQQGVEIQFASSVTNDSAMDVDEIKRFYDKIIAGIQGRMGFLDIEGSNRRKEAQDYVASAVKVFPTQNIAKTFTSMKKCDGNPDVIVVYGHGGHNELIAPDGGYEHVTGEMFAEHLHEAGIRLRFVLFVCCFAYAVAKEAFDTWITLGNDGCYFVGPTMLKLCFHLT